MPDFRFDGKNWVESDTPNDPTFGAAGSCVYVSQNLYTSANLYSNLNWFSYGRLNTPIPYAPCEGCNECWDVHPFSLNRTGGGTGANKSLSGAVFEWHPVSGADYYIVQWCKSDNFQGPTLRAAKVSTTYYELKLYTDIRRGDKVFWRVMAYDTSGKVSAKSTPRDFTYCKDNKRPKPKKDKGGNDTGSGAAGSHPDIANCEMANFCGKITGPDNLMCCHGKQMYHLQFAWSCKDEDGQDVYEFVSVQWAVTGNPDDGGEVDGGIAISAQNAKTATIEVKSKKSQKATLAAQVTLKDKATNTAFNCVIKKSINVDCHTGYPSYKPWLHVYMPIIHVTDSDYVDDTGADCAASMEKTRSTSFNSTLTDSSGTSGLHLLCSGQYVATGSVVQVSSQESDYADSQVDRPAEVDECLGQDPGGGSAGTSGKVTEVVHEARVALPMPWGCKHIDYHAVEDCIAKCYTHPRFSYFSIHDISDLQLYSVPAAAAYSSGGVDYPEVKRKHCLKWKETTINFCRTKYNLVKYRSHYGPNWKYSCVIDCCDDPPTTTTTPVPTTTTTPIGWTTTTAAVTTTTCTVAGGYVEIDVGGTITEGNCEQVSVTRAGGTNGDCCVVLSVTSAAAGIMYTLSPTTLCWSHGESGDLYAELCIEHDPDCIPDPSGELVITMSPSLTGQCCNLYNDTSTWTVEEDDECTTTTAAVTTTTAAVTTTTLAPTTPPPSGTTTTAMITTTTTPDMGGP